MILTIPRFISFLEQIPNPKWTASPEGATGCIRDYRGLTPIEVLHEYMTGHRPTTVHAAGKQLFQSERRALLVISAQDAPTRFHRYEQLAVDYLKADKVSDGWKRRHIQTLTREWNSILSVRGQILKAAGLKDPLKGTEDALSGILVRSDQMP